MKHIYITKTQQAILVTITRSSTGSQRLVRRAGIVLAYTETPDQAAVSRRLNINRNTASLWLKRWQEAAGELNQLEAEHTQGRLSEPMYRRALAALLTDARRPGRPAMITEDQKARIIALASETPETVGIPVTHWTCDTLTRAVLAKGIVPAISRSHVHRFLKRGYAQAPSK